jgi:hypothetical protein
MLEFFLSLKFISGVVTGLAIQYLFPKAIAAMNARIKARVDDIDIYPDVK